MSISTEIKFLKENLEKLKDKMNINKLQSHQSSRTSIFSTMEIRKGSSTYKNEKNENHIANEKLSKVLTKPKKNNFRITYLKDAIQFMDLKSILNLTLVNKQFNYFLQSIYFYKFMKQIKIYKSNSNMKKEFQSNLELNISTNSYDSYSKEKSSKGILGNFVGAFSHVLGT